MKVPAAEGHVATRGLGYFCEENREGGRYRPAVKEKELFGTQSFVSAIPVPFISGCLISYLKIEYK